MEEKTTLYGDGTQLAYVYDGNVTILDGEDSVCLSREAFREVVIGWERFLDRERSAPNRLSKNGGGDT
jgi:hypothetical protein